MGYSDALNLVFNEMLIWKPWSSLKFFKNLSVYHAPDIVPDTCDTSVNTDLCPHCILVKAVEQLIICYREKRKEKLKQNSKKKQDVMLLLILNSGQDRPHW